ncbi:hypothetical protein JX265_004276 [Neoarthrinium moseri]|uniref:Putative transcription factor kapC n=1 Tax=Neoarthrinium moseri TaxID=1658444 RepID=A0A9Q0ARG5_9PEZI|nr:uncharacterized protein JN550_001930 [Neoarthrinium moseri]KAI1850566.1 hypothetical protein JX266_003848 [Neoarthrinium moseri]KAI1875218.1 hypothetical protein JX265_004276 [Neoarthrinium moseri]KAI1875644.1 hypothetical protein JN550_001930 [Neoarthrinium moseri]
MDDYDVLLDLPSTSTSISYMYGGTESQIDTSASTSPMQSPYEIPYHDAEHSFEQFDGSGDSNQSEQPQQPPAKPKRKRENRYKNAPPSVLSRRRAQNRASQRAYRERKDQRIKDLEILLGEAQQKNDVLSQAYTALQTEYLKLKNEQDLATAQYHAVDLNFDPTMGTAAPVDRVDMDMYLCNDTSVYTM